MRLAEEFAVEAFDGLTALSHHDIREGSRMLLRKIMREHPERFPAPPLPLRTPKQKRRVVLRPSMRSFGSQLIEAVAKAYDIEPDELTSKSRQRHLVEARALIVDTLQKRGWSHPRIGLLLGGRDHSTTINASRNLDIYLKHSAECRDVYEALAPYREGEG